MCTKIVIKESILHSTLHNINNCKMNIINDQIYDIVCVNYMFRQSTIYTNGPN